MTTYSTVGHGNYGSPAKFYCNNCHDNTTRHISGVRGDSNRLGAYEAAQNNLCSFCHNDASVVTSVNRRNMETHVTVKSGPADSLCSSCHDVHGTTNYASVVMTIKYNTLSSAVSISYPASAANFINTGTQRGLCQVCHTETNHFRRNRNEATQGPTGPTDHRAFNADTNCLSCHTHKGGTYAFYPVGGACDSCHGYPPVRTIAQGVAGFQNTWSSARLQNYSGGGGVHNVAGHIPATANASEGLNENCNKCHYDVNHSMDTTKFADANNTETRKSNVNVVVDPRYRFSPSQTLDQSRYDGSKVTPGNTGNCSNVSCHFQKTQRWGTEK
jgi:hypothetical protein